MVCLGDYQEIDFAGIWLPGGIRVGSGVSQVQAAFWARPAGILER
jgi:hypothetical protein